MHQGCQLWKGTSPKSPRAAAIVLTRLFCARRLFAGLLLAGVIGCATEVDPIAERSWLRKTEGVVGLDGAGPSLRGVLSDYQSVLVVFWTTWCGPCVGELEKINALQAELGNGKLLVVALNAGEAREVVERFLGDHEIGPPVYLDPGAHATARFQGRTDGRFIVPYHVLICGHGKYESVQPSLNDRFLGEVRECSR